MTESFRNFEHAGWADPDVCASYDDHFSSLTTQSIGALLDAARVSAGRRVLDVATGAGYTAGAALARGADVTGSDFSGEQVRLARQRYPAAEFHECDAGSLPFEDETFDAVVSNYGVLHFPEPERFFREAFRVLKNGGRLAFTVWDVPKETKLLALSWEPLGPTVRLTSACQSDQTCSCSATHRRARTPCRRPGSRTALSPRYCRRGDPLRESSF
jgi:ubiquinone/menaquinone biosynthesis C-methylase UbiE